MKTLELVTIHFAKDVTSEQMAEAMSEYEYGDDPAPIIILHSAPSLLIYNLYLAAVRNGTMKLEHMEVPTEHPEVGEGIHRFMKVLLKHNIITRYEMEVLQEP